jgi:hypothetical protein
MSPPRSALGCYVDFYIPTGFTTPIDQFFWFHAGGDSAEKTQYTLKKHVFPKISQRGNYLSHKKNISSDPTSNVEVWF